MALRVSLFFCSGLIGSCSASALLAATRAGDLETVINLLDDEDTDVNFVDADGYTALYAAVEGGFADIAKSLVSGGADVQTPGPDGMEDAESLAYRLGYDRLAFDLTRLDDGGSSTPDLDAPALEDIRRGSAEILSATSQEDVLVFIGNSPSYFYHALKNLRETYRVPISLGWFLNRPEDPLDERWDDIRKYEEIFIAPIRESVSKHNKKIVLIDFTCSGVTVDKFAKFFGMSNSEFIHLIPDELFPLRTWSPKSVHTRKIIVLSRTFRQMSRGEYVRLVPSFPSSAWGLSHKHMLKRFDKRKQVARNIAMIEALGIPSIALEGSPGEVNERLIRLNSLMKHGSDTTGDQWQEDLEIPLSWFINRVNSVMETAIKSPQTVRNWTSFDAPDWREFFQPVLSILHLPKTVPPELTSGEFEMGFVDHLKKSGGVVSSQETYYSIEKILYRMAVMSFASGQAGHRSSTLVEIASTDFADMLLSDAAILQSVGPMFVRLVESVRVPPVERERLEIITGIVKIKEALSGAHF